MGRHDASRENRGTAPGNYRDWRTRLADTTEGDGASALSGTNVSAPRRSRKGGREARASAIALVSATSAAVRADSGGFSCAVRCFGPDLTAASTARSNRAHASDFDSDLDGPVMPQPLSRVLSNGGYVIGSAGVEIFDGRQHLAALIAESIASWSHVEAFMLRLFISMMGGPEDNAATVYMALETKGAKTSAIRAVAEKVLPNEYKNVLNVVLALIKTGQKQRDRLAHWNYGYAYDLPNAILLVDHRDMILPVSINIAASIDEIEDRSAKLNSYSDAIRSKILVYTKRDLDEIILFNNRLCIIGGDFEAVISGHVANEGDVLFRKLCDQPEIRARLNRQA